MKDGFIFHEKTMQQVDKLSDAQAGELLKAMIAHYRGEEVETSQLTEIIMVDAGERMDADAERYAKLTEAKSEAGKKGMARRWGKTENNCPVMENNSIVTDDNTVITADNSTITADNLSVSVSVSKKEKVSPKGDTKKKPAHKEKPIHFGDLGNVLLTELEHTKLIEEYGQTATDEAIAYLDAYIADKGYKHKSATHYLAMRRWVYLAVQERKPKGKVKTIPKGYKERDYDWSAIEREAFAKMMGG